MGPYLQTKNFGAGACLDWTLNWTWALIKKINKLKQKKVTCKFYFKNMSQKLFSILLKLAPSFK